MGLEAGTYISDLVSANPVAGDSVSQGDDHLRLIKACLLATFPNITGAMTSTHTALNDVSQKAATETLSGDKTFSGATEKRIGGYDYQLSPCYGGYVDSAATAERVPTGWSAAKTATGRYRVTHTIPNIGDYRDLGISVSCNANFARIAVVGPTLDPAFFEVYTFDDAGTATDAAFCFTVVLTE